MARLRAHVTGKGWGTRRDTVVFTLSRFEEFPNLWVSDTSFKNMQKVSDANPQQSEFVWGKSDIIEYINADGRKLRAILTKPDNFDPARAAQSRQHEALDRPHGRILRRLPARQTTA